MNWRNAKRLAALAAAATFGGACGDDSAPAQHGDATGDSSGGTEYVIGYANAGGVGNGFREEQVCTAKAQALASGRVSELVTIHRNTDAAGQLSDLRDLIAKGVDAIVFNPTDPDALDPALAEAAAAGIKTVSVDAWVTDPSTYNVYNDQVAYAELGARWLFERLGGKGAVYYMRGIIGHPADSDRDVGFKQALAEYPDITVVPSEDGVATQWDPATTAELCNAFIASGEYDAVDGIWTSGMDSQVVDAIKSANKPFVPIVGADSGSFVAQLLDTTGYPGLEGVAVTNTAAVGGAGVAIALKLLAGEAVATDATAPRPHTVLLTPVARDNTTDAGRAGLEAWLSVEGLDPSWPLGLQIEGLTTYTPAQAIACRGPGE